MLLIFLQYLQVKNILHHCQIEVVVWFIFVSCCLLHHAMVGVFCRLFRRCTFLYIMGCLLKN